MVHRIGRKKYKIFAMDIETHNDSESIEKQETSMWLGCFIDETNKIDDEASYFYKLDEFLDRVENLCSKRQKHGKTKPITNICIYIYNFSFEWSFLLPVLLKRGFKFKEKISDEDEYCYFNSVSTKSCSSVWEAHLKFGKNTGMVVFRDLAKLYGGGLDKVAESFNLPTQKGHIDYTKNRLHNYVVTKEEKEYCFRDTRIIVDILLKMIEKNDKEFFNAISMASYAMKKLIRTGWPRAVKPMKQYRALYPLLDKEETDFLRESVGGGITYAPSKWQFKDIKSKILHIDAHQMHPSQCYYKLFPYGKGEYFTGKPPLGKICCCRVIVSYDDVKLHSIIKLIGIDMVEGRQITIWDFEIPTMMKCYVNLRIEYIDGYAYNMRPFPWRDFYSNNYKERLKAKAIGDDFNILYYKLLNNSSYGKLLEKPHNIIYANTINENGIIDSNIIEKEPSELEINARYTYLPAGSAIPAYSRVNLIETALLFGWEKICYFDTDSIFVVIDDDTMKVWSKIDQTDFLGGWGLEEIIDRAQFTAPKRYKVEVDGETTIKAGGINFDAYKADKIDQSIAENGLIVDEDERKSMIAKYQIPYDEINLVNSSMRVKRAYRVKGGTIIEYQTKEIGVQKKYIDIYNKNKE